MRHKDKMLKDFAAALWVATKESGFSAANQELSVFIEAYRSNRDVRCFFEHPQIDRAEKVDALSQLKDRLPKTAALLCAVAGEGFISRVVDLKRFYEEIAEAESGVSRVQIESALKLSPAQAEKVKQIVADFWKSPVEATFSVNPALIAGFRATGKARSLDASLAFQLNALEEQITA